MTRRGVVVRLGDAPSVRQHAAAQRAAEEAEAAAPEPARPLAVPEVTVVDDRPVVVLGVRAVLAGVAEAASVVVVGRTASPLDAVRAAVSRQRPVVVLLDDDGQEGAASAALAAGARGVALLDGPLDELVAVVRAVSDTGTGGTAVARALVGRLDAHTRLEQLFTARERQVLELYATGIPAKSVARRMGVTEGTVKTYLKRLREKARAAHVPAVTKLDLVALARRLGLV